MFLQVQVLSKELAVSLFCIGLRDSVAERLRTRLELLGQLPWSTTCAVEFYDLLAEYRRAWRSTAWHLELAPVP